MSFKLSPGCDCCEEPNYCIRPNIEFPGYTGLFSWSTISECCWERDFTASTTPSVVTIDSDMVYRWFQRAETYHRVFADVGAFSDPDCNDIVANTTIGETWCKFIRDRRRKLRLKITPSGAVRLTVYLSFYSGVPYYNIRTQTNVQVESFPLSSDVDFTDYIYVDGDCFTAYDSATFAAIARSAYETEPTQPAYSEGTRIEIINPITLRAYGRVAASTLTTTLSDVTFSSGDADLPSSDTTPCYDGVQQNYTYTRNFGSITPFIPSVSTETCAITGVVESASSGFGGPQRECYTPFTRSFTNGLPDVRSNAYFTMDSGCCVDPDSRCAANSTQESYQREAEVTAESSSTSSTDAVIDVDFTPTVQLALWP